MTKYNCISCGYSTTRKNDHTRHITSQRHLKKVNTLVAENGAPPKLRHDSARKEPLSANKVRECSICHTTFTRLSNLTRHHKTCNKLDTITERVKVLEEENERIQREAKDKELLLKKQAKEKEKIFKKQLDTYENMLKSFTTPQAINYYNFICTNYPNTPALKGQISYHNIIDAKTMTLIEVVTMYYYDNKLVSFIGDYIIKLYKKEKSKDQSMWSTDVSRLTYIISECCNKTKETTWSYDKKGAKIKKIVIEPALKYLRDKLLDFCKESGGNTEIHILRQMIAATGTIQVIDDGKLASDVAKYIAPEFIVNNNNNNNQMVKV